MTLSLREPFTGKTLRARGGVAVSPPQARRLIHVGPGGTTALDLWTRGDRFRFAVPAIGLVKRGDERTARASMRGMPVDFLRWWFLRPADGKLLWHERAAAADRFVLRDGAAVVDLVARDDGRVHRDALDLGARRAGERSSPRGRAGRGERRRLLERLVPPALDRAPRRGELRRRRTRRRTEPARVRGSRRAGERAVKHLGGASAIAFGAVSALGVGRAAFDAGEVGEPARVAIARDPTLRARRPRAPVRRARATPISARRVDAIARPTCSASRSPTRSPASTRAPAWRTERVGVAIGTSSGGMESAERFFAARASGTVVAPELARAATYFAPFDDALAAAGLDAIASKKTQVLAACAASAIAVGMGLRWLDRGACDVVLAGGYDAISVFVASGFEVLRATTAARPRPFRVGRDGMSLGEGAAIDRAGPRRRRRAARRRPPPRRLRRLERRRAHHRARSHRRGPRARRPAPRSPTPGSTRARRPRERARHRHVVQRRHGVARHRDRASRDAPRPDRSPVQGADRARARRRGRARSARRGRRARARGSLRPRRAKARSIPTRRSMLAIGDAEPRDLDGGAEARRRVRREQRRARPSPGRADRTRRTEASTRRTTFARSSRLRRRDASLDALAVRRTGVALEGPASRGSTRSAGFGLAAAASRSRNASSGGRERLAGAGVVAGHALATLDTNEGFDARLRARGPTAVEPRLFPATSPNAVAGECAHRVSPHRSGLSRSGPGSTAAPRRSARPPSSSRPVTPIAWSSSPPTTWATRRRGAPRRRAGWSGQCAPSSAGAVRAVLVEAVSTSRPRRDSDLARPRR